MRQTLLVSPFLVSCMLLISSAALSAPKLGDFAEYDIGGTLASGEPQSGTLRYEITVVINPSKFQVKTSQVVNNQTLPDKIEEFYTSDLLGENLDTVFGSCVDLGGSFEKVQVPAGAFDTCKLPYESEGARGTLWLGNVPIHGIVQVDEVGADGAHEIVTLRRFLRGAAD